MRSCGVLPAPRRADLVSMAIVLCTMLVCSARALALDPRLDISQYGHTSWKIRDGFSTGDIRSITQTPDGYLWFATEFGLLRFDGVRAITWQPPGEQALPSNDIWAVRAARDGALWIGTATGLARWKNGTLTQYPQLAGRIVSTIEEGRDGTVWASGTAVPLGILCGIRNDIVSCSGEDTKLGFGVWGVYEDRGGNVWASAEGGIWRWRPNPPTLFRLPGRSDGFQSFDEDREGRLLVTTDEGIRQFVDGRLRPYLRSGPASRVRIPRLLRDRDGALWASTRTNGVLRIVEDTTDVFAQADGLSANLVSDIFEDREGSIWVATANGLDRFRELAVSSLADTQERSNINPMSLRAAADGSVWVSSSSGVFRLMNGSTRQIPLRGLAARGASAFFLDDRGRTWLSSTAGVGYLENDRYVAIEPSFRAVRSIVQDTRGDIWITDQSAGLLRVPPVGRVDRTSWSALGRRDFATALAVDRARGGLWLGFWDGDIAYFNDGGVRETYTVRDGLGRGRVSAFRTAPDGALWVATAGGLSTLRNGRVSTISSRNGLPCDSVHWAVDDDLGFVWLNTACGVLRVTRADLEAWVADQRRSIAAVVFDASDGVRMQATPVGYDPFVTKTTDGRLWFTREGGIDIIDPRRVPLNDRPPPVHIERVIADGMTHDANAAADGHVSLPALTRDLQIDYTALSLVAPEKMRFRYRLDGHESGWQDVGTRRQAFFNDLAPGRYRFRVVASNNSGVWNETGAALEFSIATTYYQTRSFRVAVIVAMLIGLYGIYRLRVALLARQFNVRMAERVSERTRIARELHDTLLQSFQGALLKFHAITYEIADRPQTREKLDRVIAQATQAISEGRDAVQGLRSSTMEGNDLANALGALGEELTGDLDAATAPAFVVKVEGASRPLVPLVRDDVYRIGAEALRNAFRHADARRIEVDIRYGHRVFRVRVRDDGKGIDATVLAERGRHGHYGLAGMQERASLIKGQLTIWSERDSGTEAELIVPASTAYAKSGASPHAPDRQAT
jgi:signal transduction histidine kinase/ligand-binding sensor domain-containing protein